MSTANMSSLTTSKDKEGNTPSTTFKLGDTIYATSTISNNSGKVKVNTYLVAVDAEGLAKDEVLKGSEVTVELSSDGTSNYSLPVTEAFPVGKYKLTADMVNEAGEKKDSRSTDITVENSAGAKSDDAESDTDKSDDASKSDDSTANDGDDDKD